MNKYNKVITNGDSAGSDYTYSRVVESNSKFVNYLRNPIVRKVYLYGTGYSNLDSSWDRKTGIGEMYLGCLEGNSGTTYYTNWTLVHRYKQYTDYLLLQTTDDYDPSFIRGSVTVDKYNRITSADEQHGWDDSSSGSSYAWNHSLNIEFDHSHKTLVYGMHILDLYKN